jgi:hypothetical protein
MKDWRGITVAVGDTVLYATRSSSWMGMIEGIVESIDDVNDDNSAAKVRIVRRQGGGVKELVTVSNNYLTVANLPTSAEPTLVEENIKRAERRAILQAEQDAREAACGEHEWKHEYGWRRCLHCRKTDFGDYWPPGYLNYGKRW